MIWTVNGTRKQVFSIEVEAESAQHAENRVRDRDYDHEISEAVEVTTFEVDFVDLKSDLP